MHSIGEMAEDSGLSVSTLRFYDGAGVLTPAWVDPVSGYRWYEPEQREEARVLARLRRVGMPLADVRLLLAGWPSKDTDLVRSLLEAHVRRLETGLSDARRELSMVRSMLDHRENPMTGTATPTAVHLTVPAGELAAALDAVRFAAGTDPELPMLAGVLFDAEGGTLRVVATDRYRLAVAGAGASVAGDGHGVGRVQALVPTPLADAMRALLDDAGATAELTLGRDEVALDVEGRRTAGPCPGHDFPDYRRLVRIPQGRRVPVDAPALAEAVRTGPTRTSETREPGAAPCDITLLVVTDDGGITVSGTPDGRDHIAVNRAFLLHALAAATGPAADRDRLVLELGAPTAPLAIRRADTEETFSLLMPVRLDA